MALWLVRAGRHGEHEQRFHDRNRIYVTSEGLDVDLEALKSRDALRDAIRQRNPRFAEKKIINYAGQIWPFAHEMKPGDWVVVPSKSKAAVSVAEIDGPYVFDKSADDPYFHSRSVKWVETDIPRQVFPKDLLYSFGAFMTICRIKRNDAEKRVRAMAAAKWKGPDVAHFPATAGGDDGDENVDLEQLARDAMAKLITARFKGHDLARLVDAVLKAQGYTTNVSPPGPDGGIDILAAPEPLGFGEPRLCVQVKSSQSPVDLPTLNQLIGSMQNVHAQQGLLVAWGGFKSSVAKEIPVQFFRVRLWDQRALLDQILGHYDKLDEDIRAELPLKRIWTVAVEEEDE